MIESFSKKLKRQTSHREQFPNVQSLEQNIMNTVKDYNNKFRKQAHRGFKASNVKDTLDSMFPVV